MKYLSMLLAIGVVDQIQGNMAVTEISRGDEYSETIELNLLLFPCEIREGGMFYIVQAGGVTEIRCGEPDPA